MVKVSVAKRWPLMKMPKEPESTACRGAAFSFSFSFLSLARAGSAAVHAITKHTKTSATTARTSAEYCSRAVWWDLSRHLLLCYIGRDSSARAYQRHRL